jgi:hypothetical protein
MDESGSFIAGLFIGVIIAAICISILITLDFNETENRAIELNKATYQEGEFIYLDKELQYVITGNKN